MPSPISAGPALPPLLGFLADHFTSFVLDGPVALGSGLTYLCEHLAVAADTEVREGNMLHLHKAAAGGPARYSVGYTAPAAGHHRPSRAHHLLCAHLESIWTHLQ